MKKERKGVHFGVLNGLSAVVIILFTAALIAANLWVDERYHYLTKGTDTIMVCQQATWDMHDGSDRLTSQARLYVITQQRKYMHNYFQELNVTRTREKALESVENVGEAVNFREALKRGLELSNQLTRREIYAMALAASTTSEPLSEFPSEIQEVSLDAADLGLSYEGRLDRAAELMFGTAYDQAKAEITSFINSAQDNLLVVVNNNRDLRRAQLEQALRLQRILLTAMVIFNFSTILVMIWVVSVPLTAYAKRIQEGKALEPRGAFELRRLASNYNRAWAANVATNQQLQEMADTDGLTGLRNRSAFDKLRMSFRTTTTPLALALFDVDHFKDVNDDYGHEAGDRVLQKIAELLRASFRPTDFPCRVGGDEFAVIVTDVHPETQCALREKVAAINRALRATFPYSSISVGVAFSPAGFHPKLYSQADKALYAAKASHNGDFAVYDQMITDNPTGGMQP